MSLPSTSGSFTGLLWCIASDSTWRRSVGSRASSRAQSRTPSAAGGGLAHPLPDDAAHVPAKWTPVRRQEHAPREKTQFNASILATAGMKLAPLLSVIRRSYLKRPLEVRRHCPPTNGVFATFLTGPAPQATVPTMVSSLVATSAARLASGLAGSALRCKMSEATSNRA